MFCAPMYHKIWLETGTRNRDDAKVMCLYYIDVLYVHVIVRMHSCNHVYSTCMSVLISESPNPNPNLYTEP